MSIWDARNHEKTRRPVGWVQRSATHQVFSKHYKLHELRNIAGLAIFHNGSMIIIFISAVSCPCVYVFIAQACRDQRQPFKRWNLELENHLQEQSDDPEGCSPEKFCSPVDAVDETWEIHGRPAEPPLQARRNVHPVDCVIKRV